MAEKNTQSSNEGYSLDVRVQLLSHYQYVQHWNGKIHMYRHTVMLAALKTGLLAPTGIQATLLNWSEVACNNEDGRIHY